MRKRSSQAMAVNDVLAGKPIDHLNWKVAFHLQDAIREETTAMVIYHRVRLLCHAYDDPEFVAHCKENGLDRDIECNNRFGFVGHPFRVLKRVYELHPDAESWDRNLGKLIKEATENETRARRERIIERQKAHNQNRGKRSGRKTKRQATGDKYAATAPPAVGGEPPSLDDTSDEVMDAESDVDTWLEDHDIPIGYTIIKQAELERLYQIEDKYNRLVKRYKKLQEQLEPEIA